LNDEEADRYWGILLTRAGFGGAFGGLMIFDHVDGEFGSGSRQAAGGVAARGFECVNEMPERGSIFELRLKRRTSLSVYGFPVNVGADDMAWALVPRPLFIELAIWGSRNS
jgi:hypothetical protein